MNLILILGIVAILILLIFWTSFRNWLGRSLTALWGLIQIYFPAVSAWLASAYAYVRRVIGIYSFILLIVSLVALVLITLALLINSPVFTGIAFVFSLSIVLLAWLPAGLILRLFRVTSGVVPRWLRNIIAWVAFIGFLGLVFPDFLNFRLFLGAALASMIFFAAATKIDAINKIVVPLLTMMILVAIWKQATPDSYRATVRYAVSWGKQVNASKDRGSINHETSAATTYGVILKDVKTLYRIDTLKEDGALSIKDEEEVDMVRGTIVRIVNHKEEIKVIDGQGFVNIQLAKNNGSFVGGRKYWIEAEFIQVATPRDIVPKDESLLPKNQISATEPGNNEQVVKDSLFTQGIYYIDVKGKTPYNIIVIPTKTGCARYSLSSENYNYKIMFSDGEVVQANPNTKIRHREQPKFRLFSQEGEKVKLVVS